jgi:hypothetical protein
MTTEWKCGQWPIMRGKTEDRGWVVQHVTGPPSLKLGQRHDRFPSHRPPPPHSIPLQNALSRSEKRIHFTIGGLRGTGLKIPPFHLSTRLSHPQVFPIPLATWTPELSDKKTGPNPLGSSPPTRLNMVHSSSSIITRTNTVAPWTCARRSWRLPQRWILSGTADS